ncbi:unnamed protein product [Bursaphelenchus okinawaensis]|uniref:alcohol dehydrogenase n=1 Tax=Bursaphelenchus okinawaensis TaxID=465554 RepID=A0A811KBH6_9BILA|nr:unnamed protein product [Bursaphelenchus okinawaensis]CAG9099223.1 unnamed protein product [Bursaphelenchus okinawaensis]
MSDSIPKTQIAAVFDKHDGPIEIREIPVPEIGDNDILVKIHYSGVCHTDLHAWKGDFPIKAKNPPLVGGHEGAGEVVKIGRDVKNFKVGDRAGIKWLNGSCLTCEQCRQGHENTCSVTKLSGLTHDGTFQQYAAVKATEATPIPKDIELAKAAPILCAGLTVYRALKEANVQAGQFIAIPGAGGGLGSFAIQYATAMGLRVVAIDHGSKEEHCKKLGAEVFIDAFKEDLVDQVVKYTDGGPQGVLCIAAQPKTMSQATDYVRTQGTVVLIALPKDGYCNINVFWAVVKCITVKGSYVGCRQDAIEALDFLRRGKIDVPIEVLPLKELPNVFDKMDKGELKGRVVLDLTK